MQIYEIIPLISRENAEKKDVNPNMIYFLTTYGHVSLERINHDLIS